MLTNETKRFAKFLTYEAQNSDFVPSEVEYSFASDKVFISCKDKKYKIIGVVDRFDKFDDYFRIIDYKTGSSGTKNSNLKNVFYGTKIQVYIYLYAIEKIENIKPFGAFYLPLVQSYTDAGKQSEDDYKLHGYFLGEPSLVERADKTFNLDNKTSRFLQAKYSSKSTPEQKKFVYSNNLTKQELDNITSYCLKIAQNGLSEIIDGNIKVSPFETACMFCKFRSICGIDIQNANIRKGEKVDKNTFDFMEQNDGE
jgi:ATP-dependent helicase/nuclease subunit B